jgi:glycosyltransferase involved in cell wall biosynthesis
VVVSVGGRFHAFHLASQLHKRGWLGRLLTTYYGRQGKIVPRDRVSTFFFPELIQRVPQRLPILRHCVNWSYHKAMIFDRWAARSLPECDLATVWSGFGRKTIAAARRRGAKVLLERGSTHIQHQNRVLQDEFEKFGLRRAPVDPRAIEEECYEYELADRIVVPSHYAAETFLARGMSNLLVTPYGVDVGRFGTSTKDDDTFRILFVGTASLQKGTHYLLEAFKRIKGSGVELWLAGPIGADARRVLDFRVPGLRTLGPVSNQRLASIYAQASVFVLPSLQEGLALVLCEAMASGLPVIATEATGAKEVITEGSEGFIVPPRSSDAIAERLEILRSRPDLAVEMGRRARIRAAAQTWDAYGCVVAKGYREVLGDRFAWGAHDQ